MDTTSTEIELEESHCPSCGPNAQNNILFKREDGIGFYQCSECNIQFASPRYTENSLLNLYEGEAWQKNVARFGGDWNYLEWKQKKLHPYYLVQQNINLVNRYLQPPTRILDVGCNVGLTVKGLEEKGFLSEGVEPSSLGAEIAHKRTGITVHNMELSELDSHAKYDGILMLDVLEHLYNPVQVLKECNQHLNMNGILFLHVPHHKGVSNRYKQLLHHWGIKKNFKHFGFPAHIYSFDKKSLHKILDKSGFKTIHFESWPNTLTNGKVNWFNQLMVSIFRKFSLSDYIICVAIKK